MSSATTTVYARPTTSQTSDRVVVERGRRLAIGTASAAIVVLPLLRPAGPGNSAPVADTFIGLTILATLYWTTANRRTVHVPYGWSVALLVVAGSIAALAHDQSWAATLILVQDLFLLAWCVALAAIASTAENIRWLLRSWAVAATVYAALVVYGVVTSNAALTGVVARTGPRVTFTLGDPNFAASYFVISILIIAAARYPRGLTRLVSYGLLLTALVLTGSNGGFVTMAVGALVIATGTLIRHIGLVRATAAVATAAVLVGGVLWFTSATQSLNSMLNQQAQGQANPLHQSVGRVGASEQSRGLILQESVDLYSHGSLLGIGPGATKQVLAQHQVLYVKMAHNDYVAALLERGLLGALGLLLLLGAVSGRSYLAVRASGRPELAGAVARPEALVAAVIAFGVSAGFYQVLHLRHLWALLGICAGLALAGER